MTPSPLAQAVGELQPDEAASLVQEKLDAGEAPLAILGNSRTAWASSATSSKPASTTSPSSSSPARCSSRQRPAAGRAGGGRRERPGTIVLGTVKNDIHEFGKNITGTVLSSNGIRVVDLGVDVDPQAWVDAINESGATLVGMSALLTTVFDSMRESIATIERAGLRDKVTILVGGGPMTEEAAQYVGADHYCETAQDGVVVAKNVLGVS